MSKTIISEWHFWTASIAAGICMAFVYDLLRLFRRLVRHARFAVDIEDILYWTACFFSSFALLYYGNNGVIRFAAVLGAAAGMVIYAVTVGRFFVRCSFFVLDKTIGSLLRFVAKVMSIVHKRIALLWHKIIILCGRANIFRKFGLTGASIHHKMVVQNRHKKEGNETHNGRHKTRPKKEKKKKKARISAQ